MLLMVVEGYVRSGNDGSVQIYINRLCVVRGLFEIIVIGVDLIVLIMKERRVEFVLEGYCWFDFKCIGLEIIKFVIVNVLNLFYIDFCLLGVIFQFELSLNEFLV